MTIVISYHLLFIIQQELHVILFNPYNNQVTQVWFHFTKKAAKIKEVKWSAVADES